MKCSIYFVFKSKCSNCFVFSKSTKMSELHYFVFKLKCWNYFCFSSIVFISNCHNHLVFKSKYPTSFVFSRLKCPNYICLFSDQNVWTIKAPTKTDRRRKQQHDVLPADESGEQVFVASHRSQVRRSRESKSRQSVLPLLQRSGKRKTGRSKKLFSWYMKN